MALGERATLVTELRLDDKLSPGLNKASRGLSGLVKNIAKSRAVAVGLGMSLSRATESIARGVTNAAIDTVRLAADFESALNTINTVAQVTPGELAKIGDGMRALSTSTGTALEDITSGYYDLVSAGVKSADALGVLTAANTLAIGGLSTTGEAIDLLTTAINSYGVSASKAATFADYFAEAIAAGKTTAAQLAASFAQVGPIAASQGVGIDELAAAYGRMTSLGIKTAEASTYIKGAILSLVRVKGPLKDLQKETGRNYLSIAGKKGLAEAYQILATDAKKAGVPLIELVGRQEALQYALSVTGPEFKRYQAELEKVRHSEGTAARQMAERQKGLNAQLNMLREGAKSAGITIGSALLPKLTPLVKKLNEFLAKPETQARIADFATGLAAGFEAVAKWAGTVPWDKIADGLGLAAGFAAKLVGVFASMPPEAMAAIIGLGALNKLSGGSLITELGKGLIKGVLGMTAGVVNLKAGTVVGGPGGVGGAAPVGKAGRVGTVLGGVAKVFMVGMAAAVAFELAQALGDQSGEIRQQGKDLLAATKANAPKMTEGEIVAALAQIEKTRQDPLSALALVLTEPLNNGLSSLMKTEQELKDELAKLREGRRPPPGAKGTTAVVNAASGFTVASAAQIAEAIKGADADRAGIIARVMAKTGKAPTSDRVTAILQKNARTTASASEREARRLGVLTDTTRSGLSGVTSAANATTAAVNRLGAGFTIPAPVVNTTVTVTGFTVRTLNRKTAVNRSINPAPIPGRNIVPVAG